MVRLGCGQRCWKDFGLRVQITCGYPLGWQNETLNVIQDLPDQIRTLFGGFKGYPGGDDLLATLNALCTASKHRLVKPVGQAVGSTFFDEVSFDVADTFAVRIPRWDSEKNEVELFRVGPKTEGLKYHVAITFFVVFGEVEIVKGKPVVAVLDALIGKVENIVAATEAECRRIGLIA